MRIFAPFIGGVLVATFTLISPSFSAGVETNAQHHGTQLHMLQNASGMDHSSHAMTHGPMMVMDAYARSSRPNAPTGAAFMMIKNASDAADRLVDVRSDIAARVELHTHEDDGNGVMRMMHVEDGFEIGAGETLMLERGGKHVMFMGLNESLVQDAMVSVTLIFEIAGELDVMIPVDLERQTSGGHGTHSDH